MTYAFPAFDQADVAISPAGYALPDPVAADLRFTPVGTVADALGSDASTVFGTPASVGPPQVGDASGWESGALGAPTSSAYTPPPPARQTGSAAPLRSTVFGAPTAGGKLTAQALSAGATTAFDAPGLGLSLLAQPLAAGAVFGAHSAGIITHADGFRRTLFGPPKAGRVLTTASVLLGARLGNVTAAPYTYALAAPAATGIVFGDPSADPRLRALPVAPTVRFGRPLLRRSAAC